MGRLLCESDSLLLGRYRKRKKGFASVVFMCRAEFLELYRRLAGPNPVHKRFRPVD